MITKKAYDIVIIGGGMVGATMAAALVNNSVHTNYFKIALIDKTNQPEVSKEPSLSQVPDIRVSTITPRSQAVLEKAGMWQWVKPPFSKPFKSMQVWESKGSGYIHWEAEDVQKDVMAHVIENMLIQEAAMRQIEDKIDCFWDTQVSGIRFPESSSYESAKVEIAGKEPIQARLVIGADGSKSRVREMANLRSVGFAYNQRGVVATVETAPCEEVVGWQKFLQTGPLALLPVRDGYYNIVWSTTVEHATQLEEMNEFDFADAVNEALSDNSLKRGPLTILKGIFGKSPAYPFIPPPKVLRSVGSEIKSFPLTLLHSGRYVRQRLALIGDACHVVHPLAGQGVNLGFGDVEELLKTIKYATQSGQDIGNAQLLQDEYERKRQFENLAMMGSLDGLRRIFAADPPGLAPLRNLGLDIINNVPALRNLFMNYAMGK